MLTEKWRLDFSVNTSSLSFVSVTRHKLSERIDCIKSTKQAEWLFRYIKNVFNKLSYWHDLCFYDDVTLLWVLSSGGDGVKLDVSGVLWLSVG